jgi:hypothetical protein
MKTDSQSVWLLAAGAVFFVYLVSRMAFTPRATRDARYFEARKRIAEAKRVARDASVAPAGRAAALRDAASAALEGLRHPGLAASYARRAERLDPAAKDAAVGLLAHALRQGQKYRALERLLWRTLADHGASWEQRDRTLDELLSLYDGPLHRPETAAGLRKLRSRT